MTTITELSDNDANRLFSDEMVQEVELKRKELQDYLKCVAGKPAMFYGITTVLIRDTGRIKMSREYVDKKAREILYLILSGDMKVNGKEGHWSCGCFGSRWYDADDGQIGCRVAFYSKKFDKDWEWDKPYAIGFTFERQG